MRLGFGNKCLLGLVLGLIAGKLLPLPIISLITPFGSVFIKLLQFVVVPLTFSTIVASFAKLDDVGLVRSLGIRTLFWFMFTAFIAATIGVAIGFMVNPGQGISLTSDLANYQGREIPSLSQTFLDMVPANLIGQIASGKIIPVIIAAIFVGLALTTLSEKTKTVQKFFDEFSQVMFLITRKIIRLSPYGIFALLTDVGYRYGLATLIPLIKFIGAIYLACALQLIVYAILLMVTTKRNPVIFFKQIYPAMITAFTTSSSLGTLPITIESLVDRAKVSKQVAGFVTPLSATMKMDGCGAIYPAIVCVLTASIFGINLSLIQIVTIIITATIATIGTAGVPGTASIMATVVLSSVGLPLEGLALVIGIDKIVDMMRTLTNVTGGAVCTTIVDHTYQKKLLSQFSRG